MNTQRIIRTFYRSWWRRPFWLLATFIVMPLLVGRIMMNPLLEKTVRQHLAGMGKVANANFTDLEIFLFPPSFTFRDVVVKGPSGETLAVDRLEIHLASLGDLRGSVPHARLRLVHPHLRVVTGAGDIERWVRALPAAQIDVAGVEKGEIVNAATADGRAIVQDVSGDIEGLFTGPAGSGASPVGSSGSSGSSGWQTWVDARLDGTDPIHAFIKVEPAGAWEANLTVKQVTSGGPPSGSGPISVDVRARGTATAAGIAARAVATVSWPGPEVPVAVAQDRVNRWSAKWPTSNLIVSELRAGAGTGQSLEVVMVGAPDGVAPPLALATQPLNALALVVDVVRLSNQALLPPPQGVASLGGSTNEGKGSSQPGGAPLPDVPAPADGASPSGPTADGISRAASPPPPAAAATR